MKSIVIYFAVSEEGSTSNLARKIAMATHSDIFKLEPLEPYSDNYSVTNARAREESENNARPAIKNDIVDVSIYDVIYLGFPNWYRSYPRIIATFLDNHNFDGKIIKPFCTNEEGGFGIGEVQLRSQVPNAIVKDGLSCNSETVAELSDRIILEWANKE